MDQYSPLQQALLIWFQDQGRSLPWRQTRDPYAILVAEVMLQQTQAERVIPFYHAFLQRFPTLRALAEAPTAEVLRAWGGLGYNRRALNLQRAARGVVARSGGVLPDAPPALRELQGIGPYTAAAVACFAYGHQQPVLDTNVKRVLGRLFFGPERPLEPQLASVAREVLPQGQAWEWNQALMDLGAILCIARQPRCLPCPLRSYCRAAPTFLTASDVKPSVQGAKDEARIRKVAESQGRYRAKSQPFQGSRRYYRGRIVAQLRELAPGRATPVYRLGAALKPDFVEADLPWLLDLLQRLESDGLVSLSGPAGGHRVSLPEG